MEEENRKNNRLFTNILNLKAENFEKYDEATDVLIF